MIEQARRLSPAIDFVQGDMRSLPAADGSLAGIVAFYSIIHIPRAETTAVLRELRRALRSASIWPSHPTHNTHGRRAAPNAPPRRKLARGH